MKNPSPRTHLYRLGLILVGALAIFLIIKEWQTPASWNYEVWYRQDAIEDTKKLPLVHGGNESCIECHEDTYEDATSYVHKSLNCEGCHGPLSRHVQQGEKVADAVGKSNWQCLNCHEEQISRPKEHPQFPADVRRHKDLQEGTYCVKCHDPHDPSI